MIALLHKHKVSKAVMEASGGYERDWARVLRLAGIEVRIVDPKRVRSFALSAGRLAKNDTIDAEMIAWFAETFDEAPGQTHDAAHEELVALVKARKGLIDLKTRLQSQDEHAPPGPVQKAHARVLKSLAAEITRLEAAISAKVQDHTGLCRSRRDHREYSGLRRNDIGDPHCRHAGTRNGEQGDRRRVIGCRPL
jgi:transposase